MAKEAIRFENVSYAYGRGTPFCKVAADHIDLSIREGVITGIIGHTGSGKSTVLQLMNGLLRPDEGRVYVQGEDIWAKPKEIQKIAFKVGLVFQYPEYQLFEETVAKDIAFGPKNMGLSKDEIEERVLESIRMVGLSEEILSQSPFDLSGGQKRRVAIAGIMAMRPNILILDEPTAGLDPCGREEILAQIRAYHQTAGNTVLLVSHSMEDIAKNAQKVLVMQDGKLVLFDSTQRVFEQADELVRIGLDVPQLTRVFLDLRKKGYDVERSVFSPERAAEALMDYMKKKGRSNV